MRFLELDENGEVSLTHDMVGDLPPYATLSHLWGPPHDEVTFEDIRSGTAITKSGYGKVLSCGRQAQRDGIRYFWIDACCIDRSSSAELTEAVNSLFRLFQQAEKCYVHLPDVSTDNSWLSELYWSRWFTRRWTLQELIAPKVVEFFSVTWVYLGDKVSLVSDIQRITGIPIRALLGDPLSSFSTGERMAWAAHRATVREEDSAYALMGIFGVSMPIIYGEGEDNAMRRLQDEIKRAVAKSSPPNANGMRLLVAGSDPLRMETVPINEDLQYAILSHTWGSDEVTFDDMRIAAFEQRKSYPKIKKCCDLAAKQGFDYLWVDTCCIDKSSSAELQEAICSMYAWYKNAKVCYVYLEDVVKGKTKSLAEAKWFSRGWTLRKNMHFLNPCSQACTKYSTEELIAPTFVEFYDQNWLEIGTKQSLCDHIANITSIDAEVLRGRDPTMCTVAKRMSWAAFRKTTRVEDEAYCLMGLFNVFMPMLYGEGHRAFQRLQEEIIKQIEDDTIFSWEADSASMSNRGIFARTPKEFAVVRTQRIVSRRIHPADQIHSQAPPTLTSRGLILSLPIVRDDRSRHTLLAWVSCSEPEISDAHSELIVRCIHLQQVRSSPQVYARVSARTLESLPTSNPPIFEQRIVCIMPDVSWPTTLERSLRTGEIILHASNNDPLLPVPNSLADDVQWSKPGGVGSLIYSDSGRHRELASFFYQACQGCVIVIGLSQGAPWCSLLSHEEAQMQITTQGFFDAGKKSSNVLRRCTDRARRRYGSFLVTAALKVMKSTELCSQRFGLHIEIEEVRVQPALPSKIPDYDDHD